MDFPVWDLGRLIGQMLPAVAGNPSQWLIFGLILWMVYGQYSRKAAMEAHLFGAALSDPARQTWRSAFLGLVGGAFGTAVFLLVGVSVAEVGLLYLWPLALLLALVRPRFICFAYAGGVLSLASLLFGAPRMDVPSLLALVAILHVIEACLVALSGHLDASPVYLKRSDGRVVGAFALQSFWPIPVITLVGMLLGSDVAGSETVKMPDWWPLIRPASEGGPGQELVYFLVPLVAALGYADFAVARPPAQKARLSAAILAGYSGVLLALSILASKGGVWPYAAALFSPLGHEAVIFAGRWVEERGRPRFAWEGNPVVLAVAPGSPAQAMGLRPGDRILQVNGVAVGSAPQIQQALEPWALEVTVEALRDGRLHRFHYSGKVPPLGLLLAPEPGETRYVEAARGSGVGRWLGSWWGKWRAGLARR